MANLIISVSKINLMKVFKTFKWIEGQSIITLDSFASFPDIAFIMPTISCDVFDISAILLQAGLG